MKITGKPTINPLLFFSGKICGYVSWIVLALSLAGIKFPGSHTLFFNKVIALFLLAAGLLYTFISLVNLGRSTRLGLPEESTELKTSGLYNFSRNPMYLGFNLITVSSVVYTLNYTILIIGIYSIIIYHLIILAEEKFLEKRFGEQYLEYRRKVNRYL
jgi:protein-S-isoprenylcysteine O-methyltransferase Ste14